MHTMFMKTNISEPILSKTIKLRRRLQTFNHSTATAIARRLQAIEQILIQYAPTSRILCPTEYGLSIYIDPYKDDYQRTIFLTGSYEPGTLWFMRKVLGPGDTFLDVGANIGLMSLVASRCVGSDGQVYAIEPCKQIFQRLIENIEINDCQNITPLNIGVGAESATLPIYSYPEVNIGRSSLIKSAGSVFSGYATLSTIDRLVYEHQIENIKMLKIDVEGFEYEVLQGARNYLSREPNPIICIEYDEEIPRTKRHVSMSTIHNLIMDTHHYEAYTFSRSKFSEPGTIVKLEHLEGVKRHDNVIYLPMSLKSDIDKSVFG